MGLNQPELTCRCGGERMRALPFMACLGPSALGADNDPDLTANHKSGDFCGIEVHGDVFVYIRCVLPVSIGDGAESGFGFGLWSTLSPENVSRYPESFDDDDQSNLGPMFGCLGNRLPGWPGTQTLPLTVMPQDGEQRPNVFQEHGHPDHPLFQDQQKRRDEAHLTQMAAPLLPCAGRS
ncbi:MAG: DUF2199 domain-containing protein [Pseudomonadota bacterium]